MPKRNNSQSHKMIKCNQFKLRSFKISRIIVCYSSKAWTLSGRLPGAKRVGTVRLLLSARPNDGIHLLFYGHSWSSVAPIWPKACNLSVVHYNSLPFFMHLFFLLPFALIFSCSHLTHSPTCFRCSVSFRLHPPLYSAPFSHFPFFSLWLIALMFFLWSTATSSSSELVWPHVFQEGMSRCGGEGPRGACTAKHQNNMSHSCLMTSTIQPCRALTVHLPSWG